MIQMSHALISYGKEKIFSLTFLDTRLFHLTKKKTTTQKPNINRYIFLIILFLFQIAMLPLQTVVSNVLLIFYKTALHGVSNSRNGLWLITYVKSLF